MTTPSHPTPTTSPWCVYSYDRLHEVGEPAIDDPYRGQPTHATTRENGEAITFSGVLHVSWFKDHKSERYGYTFSRLNHNPVAATTRWFASRLEMYVALERMGVPVRQLHPTIPGLLEPHDPVVPVVTDSTPRYFIGSKEVTVEEYREWFAQGCP